MYARLRREGWGKGLLIQALNAGRGVLAPPVLGSLIPINRHLAWIQPFPFSYAGLICALQSSPLKPLRNLKLIEGSPPGDRSDKAAFISGETRSQRARQITTMDMMSAAVAAAPPSLP